MGRELILSMHVNSTTWKAEKDEREVISKVKRDRGLHSLRANVSAKDGRGSGQGDLRGENGHPLPHSFSSDGSTQ